MATPSHSESASSADKSNAPVAPVKRGRGRRPGQPIKERADIPADEMQVMQLTGKEKADRRRKREPRAEQQKAIDTLVYSIYEENVAAGMQFGTISDWPDLFVYDWPVSKAHAETAEFRVNKACTLYHRKPIWGERVEVPANKSHLIPNPDEESDDEDIPCHMNGKEHVHIPFSVVRRPKRLPRS